MVLVVEGDRLDAVPRRGRHRADDLVLVHRGRRPVVGRGPTRLAEEALHPAGREAHEDAAGCLRGVAEVVDRASRDVGVPARPEGVQVVADANLEGAVEDEEELVLAGVDAWGRSAARDGRFSNRRRLAPVLSPVDLNVIVSPTIQMRSPSPAATA